MRRTFQRLSTAGSQSNHRLKKPSKLIRAVIAKREMYASGQRSHGGKCAACRRVGPFLKNIEWALCQATSDSEVVQYIGIFLDGVTDKNDCFQ